MTGTTPGGIPKVIHFTWRSRDLPLRHEKTLASWRKLHPDWEIRFWDDADIRALVVEHAPDLVAQFDGYPAPIQRADFFRIVVLGALGGVYADLDVLPLRPIDALVGRSPCFVALEPQDHATLPSTVRRGLPYLACNAFMGSVAGHPFWQAVQDEAVRQRDNPYVLDSTGPFMLTGVVLQAAPMDRPDLVHPAAWSPFAADRIPAQPYLGAQALADHGYRVIGAEAETTGAFTDHLWENSWYQRMRSLGARATWVNLWLSLKHRLRMPKAPTWHVVPLPAPIWDQHLIATDARPHVTIATPLRDAAQFLPAYRAMIEALDYPRDRLSIMFLEGDSRDDTKARLAALAEAWRGRFAKVQVLHEDQGFTSALPRWHPSIQRYRRGAIAACRNALIEASPPNDHLLFVDVDLTRMPTDTIQTMLGADVPVVMANCLDEAGQNFDQNSFFYEYPPGRGYLRMWLRDGLLQAPAQAPRIYLTETSYLNKVPLDCVGGTCLMIARAVLDAGVRFPETPHNHHIETEGLGLWARDAGFEVIGLPNLVTIHPRH